MVVHNGGETLVQSLAALLASDCPFERVVVVDDASTDGSCDVVRARYPRVQVYCLPGNRGPASARNAAFGAASTRRILFLDAGVRVEPDCVRILNAALDDDPDAVMVMPRVLDDGTATIHSDGAHAHFLGLMALDSCEAPDDGAAHPVREIGSVVSCCMVLDVDRWGASRPFDDALFYSYEDHDLGVRARLRGYRILAAPAARCRQGSGTPGLSVRGLDPTPHRRLHLNARNRWRIVLKTYHARTLLLLLPAFMAFEVGALAGAVRGGWLGEWWGAVRWSVARLPDTLRQREQVQRGRRRRDRYILVAGRLPIRAGMARTVLDRLALKALEKTVNGYWFLVRGLL